MMCGSHVYHGTPFQQAEALAAKDAELSQVTAALNKAKEENERLREALDVPVAWRFRHSESENWKYGPDRVNLWECQPLFAKEALK